MIGLEMKNYNKMLAEEQENQHYHQVRLINMNLLQ